MPATRADLANFAAELRRLRDRSERSSYAAYQELLAVVYPDQFNVDCEISSPVSGFPDITVSEGTRLLNWIEVKRPSVAISPLPKDDAERFEAYRTHLPHIALTNGWHWILYLDGEQVESVQVDRDWILKDKPILAGDAEQLIRFLEVLSTLRPTQATTYEEAVSLLATAARLIERATLQLAQPHLPARLEEARRSFTDLLKTNPSDPEEIKVEEFADILAQACTFGYLIARVEAGVDIDPSNAWQALDTEMHPFLKTTLHAVVAPDAELEEGLRGVLRTAADAVNASAAKLAGDEGRWEKVPYVYEPFFAQYRPEDRFKYGVFYTPMEITRFQVRRVRERLINELGLDGLTDSRVKYLDPACGTGTYLLALAEEALSELQNSGLPIPTALSELFRDRVVGFDVSPGPAAVAQARMSAWLRSHGAELTSRFPIFVVNSLQPPSVGDRRISRSLWAENISEEQEAGDRIKREEEVLVVIGNPPWGIRPRETFQVGPESSNNIVAEWASGARGAVISLYDLYVAFWRIGFGLLLERPEVQPPRGVISFITNRSWLRGKAFAGMRSWLRQWNPTLEIVDLGGDVRAGAKSDDEPVFAIRAGAAITTAVFGAEQPTTSYYRQRGSQGEKLARLDADNLTGYGSVQGAGGDPFAPVDWAGLTDSPALDEIFRTRYPGVKTHRDGLVIDVDRNRLIERLLAWNGELDERRSAQFNETSTRSVPGRPHTIDPAHVVPHRYRPLDNRWLYADPRFIDRPGTISRYYRHNPELVCLLVMDTRTTSGPVVIATNRLPGYNSFRGAYECHAFPLEGIGGERLIEDESPVLTRRATAWATGLGATSKDVAAYVLCIANAPTYSELFEQALESEMVRFPLTKDSGLFGQAVEVGRNLLEAWSLGTAPAGSWDEAATSGELGEATIGDGSIEFASGARVSGLHERIASLSVSTYPVVERYLAARADLVLDVELAESIRRVAGSVGVILDLQELSRELLESALAKPTF